MHRNTLLDLLRNYSPVIPEEVEAKKTMIDFIQKNPHCFERWLESGHITAGGLLLDKNGTHALLTHHAILDDWYQLGGHCDGDSNVLRSALREAQEESGIMEIEPVQEGIFDIDVHLIPAYKETKEHYHYDVRFLFRVTSDAQIIKSSESHDLRWIPKNLNAVPTKDPSVLRLFTKWVSDQY
jgi:8-oxo-dGTP pyrophosphatase MutT (NUDIX family)